MDHDLLELAERQHSLLTRSQMAARGVPPQAAWRLARGPDWFAVTPRVMARRGARSTPRQRLMAAVLDAGPGAFLSHRSAAALWKLSGFGLQHVREIDVTRPRGGTRRPSPLARIHEVLDLEADHTTVLDGIPVATPTRTVFELAGSVSPPRAERACDSAWSQNLTNRRLLDRMLGDWADRGRAGTVLMRELLEQRPFAYVPPASNLESRFAELARRHRIGPFRRQVDLGGEAWIGRVDFLHERLPLVVEVLSERYHAALVDAEADERRFARLTEVGFTVEPVWDRELWGDPTGAIERIRAAERSCVRASTCA
jgi:very-short-patch-repair endonuclease